MKFTFSITDSKQDIENKILKALLPQCKKFMDNAVSVIKAELPGILYAAITSRPEYMSLVAGTLRLEFGIPDANVKVASLIDTWISNIEYNYVKPVMSGSKINSSISAQFVKADFSDVINSDDANVITSEYTLPWLKWLLLDGSAIIVPKHNVVFGPNPRSRTGDAIMRQSVSGWKVPAEYAGRSSDNWITRAISDSESNVRNLLKKALS